MKVWCAEFLGPRVVACKLTAQMVEHLKASRAFLRTALARLAALID
jgi:hypothetical protein